MCTVAAVKIAQKSAGLADDAYRDLLLRVTGKASSTLCTPEERSRLLRAINGLAQPARRTARRAEAHPQRPDIRKLWALWYQLRPSLPAEEQNTRYLVGICRRANYNVPTIKTPDAMSAVQTRRAIEALKARLK